MQEFKKTAGAGIKNISAAKTTVYPNPVTDIHNFSFAGIKAHHVTIIRRIGAVVGNYILSADTTTFNISQLNSGLYFVKYASENEPKTFKIEKR